MCVCLRCLDYVLDEIALSGNANVMVASHNEDTVKHTLRRYGFNSQHAPLKNTHIFCTQPRICINQVINYSSLSLFLLTRMNELGLVPTDNKVYFGQLLGMCDQISFPLGEKSTRKTNSTVAR